MNSVVGSSSCGGDLFPSGTPKNPFILWLLPSSSSSFCCPDCPPPPSKRGTEAEAEEGEGGKLRLRFLLAVARGGGGRRRPPFSVRRQFLQSALGRGRRGGTHPSLSARPYKHSPVHRSTRAEEATTTAKRQQLDCCSSVCTAMGEEEEGASLLSV